jgi:hypothetical protein
MICRSSWTVYRRPSQPDAPYECRDSHEHAEFQRQKLGLKVSNHILTGMTAMSISDALAPR